MEKKRTLINKRYIEFKRFIFTDTPSSGKTSVILMLEKLGHAVIHEAATDEIEILRRNIDVLSMLE